MDNDVYKLACSSPKPILIDLEDLKWAAAYKWHINLSNTLGPYRLITDTKRVYLRNLIGKLKWPPGVNPQSPLRPLGRPPIGLHRQTNEQALTDPVDSLVQHLGASEVVYKNGNPYDNTRSNLIQLEFTCEQDLRLLNGYKSGYRGVTWDASRNRWQVQVYYKGAKVHSSYHLSELEAALKWNELAPLYNKKLNEIAH